jgi:hypothetical protein
MPVLSCSTDESCSTDDRAVTERGDYPGVPPKTMRIKHQEQHVAGRDLAEEAVTRCAPTSSTSKVQDATMPPR